MKSGNFLALVTVLVGALFIGWLALTHVGDDKLELAPDFLLEECLTLCELEGMVQTRTPVWVYGVSESSISLPFAGVYTLRGRWTPCKLLIIARDFTPFTGQPVAVCVVFKEIVRVNHGSFLVAIQIDYKYTSAEEDSIEAYERVRDKELETYSAR